MNPTSLGRSIWLAVLMVGFACPSPAPAQPAPQPALVATYGDWGVYQANSGGRKVCFALSNPVSATTDPPNRPRDPAYLFISTRPAEGARNEPSVIMGYPLKPDAEATAEIGSDKYVMQTQNDNAWLKNPAEEPRMIDSMRKGSEVVVKGVSSRGTKTTDRYSLKGLGQALDRVGQECK